SAARYGGAEPRRFGHRRNRAQSPRRAHGRRLPRLPGDGRHRARREEANEVTNFMWGGSGTSVGWKRSEKWAAKVEKDNFKKKPVAGGTGVDGDESGSYSETGMIAGGSGKFGIKGVASGTVGAKFGTGKHYDYDSITNISNKKGRKKLGEVEPVPLGMRGGGDVIGESVHSLELSGAVEGGPFSGS